MAKTSALVLFSGGQDSTVCLAWALERFARVETVGFDYEQRHRAELEARPRVRERMKTLAPAWAARLGEDHVLELGALAAISDTALTREVAIAIGESGLPTTFVPGRNLVFLAFVGALGYRRGAKHLVAGMCETDFSGYPDCRPEYIRAFEQLAGLATRAGVTGSPLRVHTPLIAFSKAEIVRRGLALGLDYGLTLSCYDPGPGGRPCGHCDSCQLRAKGFAEAGVADPALTP